MAILKGGTTIGGYEATHKENYKRHFHESGLDCNMALNGPSQNNINGKSNIIHYKDIACYAGTGVNLTGTIKITFPFSWTNTMGQYVIKGYNYSQNTGSWEVRIGGYNYASNPVGWVNYSLDILGSPPFNSARLGHDGAKCCILLGTTSTIWEYPQIVISDFIAGYGGQIGWQSGWSIELITSEIGIASIVTPIPRIEITSANVQAMLNTLPNI